MFTKIVTNTIQKRIVVGVMAVTMLFGMITLTPKAEAQSSSEMSAMQTQIEQLTKLLNALLAQFESGASVTSEPEGGFATSQFSVGDSIKTTANLKVRSGAGVANSWMNNIPPYTTGTITGGPRYADGYTWWQVAYSNGTKGWSAEGWFTKLSSSVTKDAEDVYENMDKEEVSVKVVSPNGDTYQYGDRMTVKWNQYGSVPKGSKACVSLYSVAEGRNFTFPGNGGCVDIAGEEPQRKVTGEIVYSSGYRLEPGKYYVKVRLIAPPTVLGKDGSIVATDDDAYIWIEEEDSANDEIDRLIDLVNDLQSKPSCSIRTSSSGYEYGDRIKLIWDSNNASYASFVQDTSGKDSLWLPGDKLSADGYQYIDANVTGNPTVTLKVSAGIGGETAVCSVRIPIDQNDSNQSEIDRLIDLVDDLQGGTYKGYMDGNQFIQTDDISREYAVENCELNANNNPHRTVYCTWNNEVVFTKEAAMEPEAGDPPEYNAYACDRANGSIVDHKSACYGVWDYGNSFGNDKDMCGAYSSYELGCVIDAPVCASGLAEAVDHFSNSELKKMSSYQLGIIANNLETTSEIVKEGMAGMWEYNCVSE